IGDGGLDLAEDRSPAWRGDRSDQNFTGLYVRELIGVHNDSRGAFHFARGSGHTFELAGVLVVAGEPVIDLFGGDAPEHAGKRFGDGLRRGIQSRSRPSGLECLDDLATTLNFF